MSTETKQQIKKVFVTGATGYVGRHLVESLIKKGYIVYVLSRHKSSIFINRQNVFIITGDINDTIELPSDIDTIYHCAGVIYKQEEMEKVNILGTQNIVNLAIKHNCKLVYLSSAGVVGKTDQTIINEDTLCNPQNQYEKSKYEAEKYVIDSIKKGLQVHILRPVTIFGPDMNPQKDIFLQLVRSMRNGLYKNIGQGIFNIVYIDEVILALTMLGEATIPYGGIYIISNHISYRNMDNLVKNIEPRINKVTQDIPYFIAFIASIFLTFFCFLINKRNPLTLSRLRALTNKSIYTQNKLGGVLDLKNTLTLEQHIEEVCVHYMKLNQLQ